MMVRNIRSDCWMSTSTIVVLPRLICFYHYYCYPVDLVKVADRKQPVTRASPTDVCHVNLFMAVAEVASATGCAGYFLSPTFWALKNGLRMTKAAIAIR